MMKSGLIARADNSGLGVQTHEFYKHMTPTRTMVVDIGHLNHNKSYPERYPDNAVIINGFPDPRHFDAFLEGLDIVFVAEAAYNPYLYVRAKELGVKTAVQYNYEFMDWIINDNYPKPDMLIAPSRWHYDEVDNWCKENNIAHVYLHCPVNRELLPFRVIEQAKIFLHPAGKAAAHDRNGTEIVIGASKYLRSDAQIHIHFQGEQGLAHQATHTIDYYKEVLEHFGDATKITINQWEFDDYAEVYNDADVLILPRRYGGNCLPVNEALSTGMPVIMTDISPNNALLPANWLIPASKVAEFTPRTKVDIYASDPKSLAAKIDEFYFKNASEMRYENITANNIAQSISWQALKPKYIEAFEQLCNQ